MSIYEGLQKVEVNPEVLQVQQEIEIDGIYEKFFPISEGDLVVDIGAHVGVFTRKAARVASKVYALEPDPLFFKDLQKQACDKIIVINKGISDVTRKAKMISDGHANAVGDVGVDIELVNFKDVLKEYGIKKIDFLKVDCEGGEYPLFIEHTEWLAKNCTKIAGEFHIHSDEHRKRIVHVLDLFDQAGIKYALTTIDGMTISNEHLFSKLDYYTEILFYAISPEAGGLSLEGGEIISYNFVRGIYVQVNSTNPTTYRVDITSEGVPYYNVDVVGNGGWCKAYAQHYMPAEIKVTNNITGKTVFDYTLDLKDQTVVVEIDSYALGDTIAWFPYMAEFQKKHRCKLWAATGHNYLFRDTYPELNFLDPGQSLTNVNAWYMIAWGYNEDGSIDKFRNTSDPKSKPMQQTAADILGIPYRPIKPKLAFTPKERPTPQAYVCIANHSTSQAKYWNNPTGWQELVDYLKEQGYEVVLLSREADGHNGNFNPKGVIYPDSHDMQVIMNYLHHAEFFVGIGSGLSWLSWALNTPTVVISGFSEPYTEPADIRITAKPGKCSGCFNRVRLQNDGDWNWCPDHKGTPRQFECSKSITGQSVIQQILPLINKNQS